MNVDVYVFMIYSLLFPMVHINGWRLPFDQAAVTNVTDLDIPGEEKYIYIRHSLISSLPAGGFSHLTQCERLYLDGNQIESVNREAFLGLEELRFLDLSENIISSLQQGTFKNLTKLEYLYINKNKQNLYLYDGVFSGLVNVKEISINSSRLRSIGNRVFSGLPNLQRIHLSRNYDPNYNYNKLTLPGTLFQEMSSLEHVDLSWNYLNPIPSEIFRNSFQLKTIYLFNAYVRSLPDRLFRDLINLVEVYLGNYRYPYYYSYNYRNEIRTLPSGLFTNCTQLKRINIQNCQLREIKDGVFDDTISLEELDVSGNYLGISPYNNLPYNLMMNLQKLVRLDLSSNNALNSLPDMNNLENLEILDISLNHLRSLPDGFVSNCTNLKYMHLSNNYINALPYDLFYNLWNLKSVELDSQGLNSLSSSAFKDLQSTTEINICCNNLQLIPDETFSNTKELMYLYLQTNQLKSLPKGLLKNLHNLVSVDLRNNELTYLPEELLSNCWRLKHLHLENNRLSSLPDDFYHSLQSLTAVNLDSNELTIIRPMSFQDLSRVRTVEMSNNRLNDLPSGLFRYMRSVTSINLYNNHLHSLPSNLFQNLPNLNIVDLSYNPWMGPIPAEIFRHSPKIYEIDLEANNKVTLEELELPDKNVSMNLDGNDFHCDIKMCWLFQRLQTGTIILIHNETGSNYYHYHYWNHYIEIASCSSPSNLAGREIADILPNDIPGCAEDIANNQPTVTPQTIGPGFDPCKTNQCKPGKCERDGKMYICNCPAGFIATQTHPFECKQAGCSKGEYFSVGDCKKCPKGTYSYVGNLVECLKCPAFYTTLKIGSTSIQDCVLSIPCQPGHFKPSYGICIMCPDGTFQTDGYHSKCVKCDKNETYSTGGPGATYHGFCGKNVTTKLETFKINFGLPFVANYSDTTSEEYLQLTQSISKTLNDSVAGVLKRYFRGFAVKALSEDQGDVVAEVVASLMDHPYSESMFNSAFLHLNLSNHFPWSTKSFYGGTYPVFNITSLNPRKGPQNGGTNITLSGTFLYLHGTFQVYIGALECPINSYNDTAAFCLTAHLKDDSLKNVFQNITIIWQSDNIKPMLLNYRYMYKSNPVIYSVLPAATIISGGTWITVIGSNIDSVSESVMEVTAVTPRGRNQYFMPCTVLNNTHLKCITPDLTNKESLLRNPKDQCDLTLENSNFKEDIQTNITKDDIAEVFANFIMDRATDVLHAPEKLKVYPDAVFLDDNANKVNDYVAVWPCTHDRIKIKGSNLAAINVFWPGAYQIRIGDVDGEQSICKDIKITNDEISCLPPKDEPFDSKSDNVRVIVSVACRQHNVYDLKYISDPFYCSNMKIGFGIGVGLVVSAIISIICCCICYKHRQHGGNPTPPSRYPKMSSWKPSWRQRKKMEEPYTSANTRHPPSGAYTNTIMPPTSGDAIPPGQTRDAYLLPRISPIDNRTRQRMQNANNREDSYQDGETRSEVGYYPNSYQDTAGHDYYNQQEITAFRTGALQYESHFTSHEMYQSTPDHTKTPNRPISQYVNSQEAGIKLYKGFTGAYYQRGRHN